MKTFFHQAISVLLTGIMLILLTPSISINAEENEEVLVESEMQSEMDTNHFTVKETLPTKSSASEIQMNNLGSDGSLQSVQEITVDNIEVITEQSWKQNEGFREIENMQVEKLSRPENGAKQLFTKPEQESDTDFQIETIEGQKAEKDEVNLLMEAREQEITEIYSPDSMNETLKDDSVKTTIEINESNDLIQPDGSWSTIKSENVEGAWPNNWNVKDDNSSNGYDYWGDISCKSHNGSWSAWAADIGNMSNCNTYDNYMKSWMIYGPFDLSDATDAELTFYYWNDSESNYDYFKWMASSNGSSFNGYQVSGNSVGWTYKNFDLSPYKGDSSVWVAFLFTSDGSVTREGAYVDDITLKKYISGSPDLTKSSLSISKTTVNPGETIDINVTVSNQGNESANASYVYYYWKKDSRSYTDTYKVGSDHFPALGVGSTSAESFSYQVPGNASPGTYYLYYWIDAPQSVTESSESNNKYYWTITVQDKPDLTEATATINKTTAFPGERLDTIITIKNQGGVSAGSHYVYYYWQKDNRSYTNTYKAGESYVTSLSPGSTSGNRYFNYTIPSNVTPGTYYLYYWIDAPQSINESNESNNKHYWTITVNTKPDLMRSTANINKTSVVPGEALNIDVTVKNQGGSTANANYMYYYWKKNSRFYTDTYKVGKNYVGSLGVNTSSLESFSYTVPTNTSPGTYYLYYWIDAGQVVDESNESNNKYYWTITVSGQADLTKYTDSINKTNFLPGESLSVDLTIKNQGTDTSVESKVYYYLKKDSESYTNTYKVGEDSVNALTPNSTASESFAYQIPSDVSPGTYYFYYWIDAEQNVPESIENNNRYRWTISVADNSKADLIKHTDSINKISFKPGEQIDISLTAKNQGNATSNSTYVYYYFKKDSLSYTNNYKVGDDSIMSLSPNGASVENFSYTIPNGTSPGTYYLYYWLDAPQSVDESIENNNRYYWTITITDDSKPDLTAYSHGISKTNTVPGDVLDIDVTIKNQGNAVTGQTAKIYYYFHSSRNYSNSYKIGEDSFSSLSVNQTNLESFQYTIPDNLSSGTYYLYYWIDAPGDINESEEGNNQFYFTVNVGQDANIVGIAMPGARRYLNANTSPSALKVDTINPDGYTLGHVPVYLQGDTMTIVIGANTGDNLNGMDIAVTIKDSNGNYLGIATRENNNFSNWLEYFGFNITKRTFSYTLPINTEVGKGKITATLKLNNIQKDQMESDLYVIYNAKDWLGSTVRKKTRNYNYYVNNNNRSTLQWLAPGDKDDVNTSTYTIYHTDNTDQVFPLLQDALNSFVKDENGDIPFHICPYVSGKGVASGARNGRKWVSISIDPSIKKNINGKIENDKVFRSGGCRKMDTILCLNNNGAKEEKKNEGYEFDQNGDYYLRDCYGFDFRISLKPGAPFRGVQCHDFMGSLIDYFRMVGIPARPAGGMHYDPWNYHQWVEAYVARTEGGQKEWVVYDATNFEGTDYFGVTREYYGQHAIGGYSKFNTSKYPNSSGIWSFDSNGNKEKLTQQYFPNAKVVSLSVQNASNSIGDQYLSNNKLRETKILLASLDNNIFTANNDEDYLRSVQWRTDWEHVKEDINWREVDPQKDKEFLSKAEQLIPKISLPLNKEIDFHEFYFETVYEYPFTHIAQEGEYIIIAYRKVYSDYEYQNKTIEPSKRVIFKNKDPLYFEFITGRDPYFNCSGKRCRTEVVTDSGLVQGILSESEILQKMKIYNPEMNIKELQLVKGEEPADINVQQQITNSKYFWRAKLIYPEGYPEIAMRYSFENDDNIDVPSYIYRC